MSNQLDQPVHIDAQTGKFAENQAEAIIVTDDYVEKAVLISF
jgi:hypothetical protein